MATLLCADPANVIHRDRSAARCGLWEARSGSIRTAFRRVMIYGNAEFRNPISVHQCSLAVKKTRLVGDTFRRFMRIVNAPQ
jgi:hypothetical protein